MDILTGATSINLAIGDALNVSPLCTGIACQMRTKSPVINAGRKERKDKVMHKQDNEMVVLDTPEGINMFRMLSLKGALSLETKGMKGRGRSAYSIIKEEFGLKGNKQKVLDQFTEIVNDMKTSYTDQYKK